MNAKRVLSVLLAVVMLLSVIACGGNDETSGTTVATTPENTTATTTTTTTTTTPPPTGPELLGLEKATYKVLDNLDKVKIFGRGIEADGGITADWSASGIEFKAYCEGTVSVSADCSGMGLILFSVYVDGELQSRPAMFYSGKSTATVATELSHGEHTFRLVRRHMAENGNTPVLAAITGIEVYGELKEKPADKALMIEFVGDSITCGYGIGSTSPADGSYTYAYQTAEKLNADYSMIAISGIGVYKSTSRHSAIANMSASYDLNNWYRSKETRYTPARQADIVVVNLNTNDNSQVASLTDDALEEAEAGYKAAAKLLIQKIRAAHGEDVKIVWTMGMMSNSSKADKVRADEWLKEVFAELGGEAAGYYTVTLIRDTSAAAGHPDDLNHSQNANRLASFIESNVLPDISSAQ